MKMRALLRTLLLVTLIAPPPALAPASLAQTGPEPPKTGTPPADPPYPGGAIIESIPPDAIVLSLDDTIKQALNNNLAIIVQRYQPRSTATLIDIQQSTWDPLVTGALNRTDNDGDSVQKTSNPPGTPDQSFALSRANKSAWAQWFDPLTIGGSYAIRVEDNRGEVDSTSFVPTFNDTVSVNDDSDDKSWLLTYNQSLLRGFGRDANIWPIVVAQKSLGISESVFRQTVIDTVSDAEKAYWDLNFAILQLRTARFSLKLAQDFLEQNRIKVRVGTLAPIEITQAEAGVADREEAVIIFESALRLAEDNIRRVIGTASNSQDWTRPVRPSEGLRLEEVTIDEDEAMNLALANRPDLEQARLFIEGRESEARARRNLRRWGLDFRGTYGNTDSTTDTIQVGTIVPTLDYTTDGDQTDWTASLLLSVPIHNREAIANQVRADNELEQAKQQLALTEQSARVEISSAVRAVNTSIRRVQSSQVNVRLQREKLQAEQKKFENGMSTSFQVLQFQDDLANAETRENLARADYNKSLVEMSRVKGTILTELGIMVSPAAGGEDEARSQSSSLRPLWQRPAGGFSEPGLRLAERGASAVHLPDDFVFEAGAHSAVTTDWIGGSGTRSASGAGGGTGTTGMAGGR